MKNKDEWPYEATERGTNDIVRALSHAHLRASLVIRQALGDMKELEYHESALSNLDRWYCARQQTIWE